MRMMKSSHSCSTNFATSRVNLVDRRRQMSSTNRVASRKTPTKNDSARGTTRSERPDCQSKKCPGRRLWCVPTATRNWNGSSIGWRAKSVTSATRRVWVSGKRKPMPATATLAISAERRRVTTAERSCIGHHGNSTPATGSTATQRARVNTALKQERSRGRIALDGAGGRVSTSGFVSSHPDHTVTPGDRFSKKPPGSAGTVALRHLAALDWRFITSYPSTPAVRTERPT